MTSTRKLTFADYLALDDSGLERRAELIDGVLTELPPETWFNNDIAMFLFLKLVENGIPFQQVKVHSCELQTPILESGDAANRYPDLVVVDEVHRAKPNQRMTITLNMPPPRLVVEVVSPGKTNRDRDYLRKRAQYAAIGIPEYLIVDPQESVVILLVLAADGYREAGCYQGKQRVQLLSFPDLELTAEEILAAGQVG
ncbi:Uma2 family endonuclease [Leptodesmis sichuanensis]|uniref:Uma2 family endonuclease n=1 Tax=Leptodesmis sichuanensis TaxID=2906798 RepID=UPI001F373951|nr:Uma2 family endonuclease [Leptodesmis sichuanensis]UIE37568.1 Uma2 family endonuclease [Leptodesmis sichuanensis A121]